MQKHSAFILWILILLMGLPSCSWFSFEKFFQDTVETPVLRGEQETALPLQSAATAGISSLNKTNATNKTFSNKDQLSSTKTTNKLESAVAKAGLSSLSAQTRQNQVTSSAPLVEQQVLSPSLTKEINSYSPSDCFEVKWLVPAVPVNIYHLKFGPIENNLKAELILPTELLQKKDDPSMGPVFSYKLLCDTELKFLFVQISSENKFGRSPYGNIIKLSR